MNYIISVVSLIVLWALAWLVSNNRKAIRYKPIFVMIVMQIALAALLLKTSFGNHIIKAFADGFAKLLGYGKEGIFFVFGELTKVHIPGSGMPFFFDVLMPIVFISALIGVLQHWHILGFIIKYVGIGLSKINGMGKLESYNAVASAILGQSEVFISVKKQLGQLPEHRLYTLCTSAMSTVSMSIVGAYMTMLDPRYVVTALVLNMFGGFIIASIINPYQVSEEDDILVVQQDEKQSFFEMLGEYILDGFKVAVIVAAMLIGFIALIKMADAAFLSLFSISFQNALGYLFSPLAFLSGVPWNEAIQAGGIMATKIVSNEFVAMLSLSSGDYAFSARTTAIVSVFLVSFANFSSIGIISGAIKALDSHQGNVAARFGLKLLYGASLVSFLNATLISLLV